MSTPKNDYVSGVDARDRRMKDKLMSQFVNHDSTSRPVTKEYAEGWDRVFGKKQERSDSVNDVAGVLVSHTVTDHGSDIALTLVCTGADCPVCRAREDEPKFTLYAEGTPGCSVHIDRDGSDVDAG